MLLMVEKSIRGEKYHIIYWYAEANNKYKICDKNKDSSYLKYWGVNNLYGCTLSQKLLSRGFKWVEEISQVNEDFIKSYYENSNERYFLWSWCSIFSKITWP